MSYKKITKAALPILLFFACCAAVASPVTAIHYAYPTDIEKDTVRYEYTLMDPSVFNPRWTTVHESISLTFKKFKGIKTYGKDISLTLVRIEQQDGVFEIHFKENGFVEWDDVDVFRMCIYIGIGKTLGKKAMHGVKHPDIKGFRFIGGRYGKWPKKGYYEAHAIKTVEK